MVVKQIKELVYKYCQQPLTELGFEVKANKSFDISIRKKRPDGFDALATGYNIYADTYFLVYGLNKINNRINKIMLELQEKVTLDAKVDKQSRFLFFSYNTIHDPSTSSYLPQMKTEEDVKKCVGMMIDFVSNTGIPILDRFENLCNRGVGTTPSTAL